MATYIYINDSGNNTWQVGVSDAGVLSAAPVSAQSPSPVYLNDFVNNTTSWLLAISTQGVLEAVTETYNSTYPTQQSLTSPSGYVFSLAVTPNGVIVAIYFEPDEDFWMKPLVQPFEPVVTAFI
jgi:hypothetical protein